MAPILRDSDGDQRLLQGRTGPLEPTSESADLRDPRFQFSLRARTVHRTLTGSRRLVLSGIRWGRKPITKG